MAPRRKSTDGRVEQEANPDRISELHEPLLIKILSLLNAKDAVKTSIFSKRWKSLWTHMDNLVFDSDGDISYRPFPQLFTAFVHNVLMRCTSHNLKKFSIQACLRDFGFVDKYARDTVSYWLERALKKNVECVKLEISDFRYRAPQWFYHNSSLVNLEIRGWKIMIRFRGEFVDWASLKSLTLSRVSVRNDRMKRILSGCPVLENLVLDEVVSMSNLHIESPSVRKLKVVLCRDSDSSLDIYAPWIRELEISGMFYDSCLKLIDVSSLVNAKLFRPYNQLSTGRSLLSKEASALLNSVHHVEELALGPVFIEAISYLILPDNPSPFFPLFKWKHLTVQLPVNKYELPGIVCLLQRSPDLETLVIEVENFSQNELEKYFGKMCDSDEEDIYLSLQTGDFPHLKTVEVAGCKNACYREDVLRKNKKCREYEFVAYLLRNAHTFKKIFVTSQKEKCRKCSTYCQLQYASMLSQKIQSNYEFAEEWELKEKQFLFEFNHCGSNSKPSTYA